MSRTSIVLLIITVAMAGYGVYHFYPRSRPSELDIAAATPPELPPIKFAPDDWPWWRGPTRDNHSANKSIVTKFGDKENVIWKTPIPGRGHSSPILLGDRIFVTSADDASQFAMCLDRATGEVRWRKNIHEKNLPKSIHSANSHASGTPATDGERLFVAFYNGNAVYATALSLDGEVQWTKEVGPYGEGSHGYGSSVAVFGPYVYVSGDSPAKGWIAALNRQTGEFGWRQGRKTKTGSYGTPTIAELGGRTLLLLVGNGEVAAYDPLKGELVWKREGLGEVSGNTVTVGGDMVFASSGYPEHVLLALNADGSVAWSKKGNLAPYPPTMLYRDKHLYVVSEQEHIACLEAATGVEKWSDRVGQTYSSPLLVGEHILIGDQSGAVNIIETTPEEYIHVRKNKLPDGINASPVVAGGRLYIRTETHLYCIGNNK